MCVHVLFSETVVLLLKMLLQPIVTQTSESNVLMLSLAHARTHTHTLILYNLTHCDDLLLVACWFVIAFMCELAQQFPVMG